MKQPVYSPVDLLAGQVAYPEGYVVVDTQVREQGVVLKDKADPAHLRRQAETTCRIQQHPVVQLDISLVESNQTGNGVQGHGLAGADRPRIARIS